MAEEYQFNLIKSNIDFNLDYIIIEIESSFYISTYIPHRGNAKAALKTLTREIRSLSKKEIFLMGDFNIDLLKEDSTNSMRSSWAISTYPALKSNLRDAKIKQNWRNGSQMAC